LKLHGYSEPHGQIFSVVSWKQEDCSNKQYLGASTPG